MPKLSKPNTAVVQIRFRVPKGVTGAQARKLVANYIYGPLYLDGEEEQVFGAGEVKFQVSGGAIVRPAAKPKRARTCL